MVACQVKTLSFLTYLLKGFTIQMKPHQEIIASSVVMLLQRCPANAVSTRKELLVATRHILATDFRHGFFKHVDTLLKEEVLIGNGRQAKAVLRPLAYSTVADLVHHVRAKLGLEQLSRIIYIFSRNIHDSELPLTIQTTSVRLLLNLVDNIYHNDHPIHMKGWHLLLRILSTLVDKFETLSSYIPVLIAREERNAKVKKTTETNYIIKLKEAHISRKERTFQKKERKEEERFFTNGIVNDDSTKDAKALIRTMVLGLKTVVWCISNYKVIINEDYRNSSYVETESRAVLRQAEQRAEQARLLKVQQQQNPNQNVQEVRRHLSGKPIAMTTHGKEEFFNFLNNFFEQLF